MESLIYTFIHDLGKIPLFFDQYCTGLQNEMKIMQGIRRKLGGHPTSLRKLQTDLGLYFVGGGGVHHHHHHLSQ